MLINQTNLNDAFTGFNAAYKKGFEGAPTQFGRVAMTVPSTSSSEMYGWLGQVPKMREWVGDRVIKSLQAHSYTIKNKKFESTVDVAREDFEDDKYGIFSPLFEELGRAAAENPDELVFALLKSGFTTACYDGQFFFDIDHPVKMIDGSEVSVANTDGGSGTPWFLLDTSRAVKPLIYQERIKPNMTRLDNENDPNVFFKDQYIYGVRARSNVGFGLWQLAWGSKQTLDVAHYIAARVGLSSMRGDEERTLGIRPTLLVVPASLEAQARAILMAETLDGGASNPWKGTAELLVSPWL
jgi:phage major head subunit gpT-like protein